MGKSGIHPSMSKVWGWVPDMLAVATLRKHSGMTRVG